ncbi:DUF3833 domain-containing protein [Rhodopseudomonas sp. P1]|uniref:DUF3833 family protein n=1 Tax=Rhodopseudomonas sp. P1 TaxID=3434357 RepID=UPI0031FD3AA6
MSIKDFNGTTPVFLPERFFDGCLEGWAVLESLVGGLQKRAVIRAEGRWSEAEGTVHFTEVYRFDDGHEDTLHWAIHKVADGKYNGSEPRLEGPAEGYQAGCAFNWRYTRNTPQKDGGAVKLNFDDWFYLIEENACIVRGSAGRAGLPFGTAHVAYRKIS